MLPRSIVTGTPGLTLFGCHSLVGFALGDTVAQLASRGRGYDWYRTLRLSVYGALVAGAVCSGLQKQLPEEEIINLSPCRSGWPLLVSAPGQGNALVVDNFKFQRKNKCRPRLNKVYLLQTILPAASRSCAPAHFALKVHSQN